MRRERSVNQVQKNLLFFTATRPLEWKTMNSDKKNEKKETKWKRCLVPLVKNIYLLHKTTKTLILYMFCSADPRLVEPTFDHCKDSKNVTLMWVILPCRTFVFWKRCWSIGQKMAGQKFWNDIFGISYQNHNAQTFLLLLIVFDAGEIWHPKRHIVKIGWTWIAVSRFWWSLATNRIS